MLHLSGTTQKMNSVLISFTIALMLSFLTGCGKKGPLYVPENPPKEAKVAPASEQPTQEKAQEQP